LRRFFSRLSPANGQLQEITAVQIDDALAAQITSVGHCRVTMTDVALLGPSLRRFLLEHLVGERNLARKTQHSYRDRLRLLLPFAAERVRRPIDGLKIEDISADQVRMFLREIEEKRDRGVLSVGRLRVAGAIYDLTTDKVLLLRS
jgi:Phage integrase, N-terminal SAM-like domain